jgi:hypothetical protein
MRYVKYFLLVVLLGVGVLDLIYVFFRHGYNVYNRFEQSRLTTIFSGKENFDILFIGSSRTYWHVNPKVIDGVMHSNSYNAGILGGNLFESALILRGYLANHPAPKLVVVDLASPSFEVKGLSMKNPNMYYPFLSNQLVLNALKPYKRVSLLRYFPFFQITECDDFLREGAIAGLAGLQMRAGSNYKGYQENGDDTIPLPFKVTYLATNFQITDRGKWLFLDIIQLCKDKDIEVVVTYAPIYQRHDEKLNPAFFPTIRSLCQNTGTLFLNYRDQPQLQSHKLFKEELHLNKTGANLFSNILAKDLLRYGKYKPGA